MAKTDRLETRLEPEQRALLEQAAAARGQSLSGFVVAAALTEAAAALRDAQLTVIPAQFTGTFVKLLEAPPGALAGAHKRLAEYEPLQESVTHAAK